MEEHSLINKVTEIYVSKIWSLLGVYSLQKGSLKSKKDIG